MGDQEIDRSKLERSQSRQHAENQSAHRNRDHDPFPAVGIDRLARGGMFGVFGVAFGDIGHERAGQKIDGRRREHDGDHGEGEARNTQLGEFVEKAVPASQHGAHREDQHTRGDKRQHGVGLTERIGKHRSADSDSHAHHDQYFHDASLSSRS